MAGLRAAPRSGPWREVAFGTSVPVRWAVWNGREYAVTSTGRARSFTRRARAYAYAEQLNEREFRKAAEARAALGL